MSKFMYGIKAGLPFCALTATVLRRRELHLLQRVATDLAQRQLFYAFAVNRRKKVIKLYFHLKPKVPVQNEAERHI